MNYKFQKLLNLILFLFLSVNTILVAQETDIYKSIQLGTFSSFELKDYEQVRSIGYVYAEPLAGGKTRVLLGGYNTESDAKTALSKARKNGFPDAFITTKQLSKDYTVSVVQLATFKQDATIKWPRFLNVGEVYTIADGQQVKIVTGNYIDAAKAQKQLAKVKEMGFSEAFIKQVNQATLHWVNPYETGGLNQSAVSVIKMVPSEYSVASSNPSRIPTAYDQPTNREFTARSTSLTSIPRATDKSVLIAIKTNRRPMTSYTPPPNNTKPNTVSPPSNTRTKVKRSANPRIYIKSTRTSVQWLQELLQGYGNYDSTIDGMYGALTHNAYLKTLEEHTQLRKYILAVQAAGSPSYGDCRDWETVQLLSRIAQDIGMSSTTFSDLTNLKSIFNSPNTLDENELQLIVSWDYRFRRGLKKWATTDPLRAQMADALKIAYLKAQIQLEDHFAKKGVSKKQSKGLAMTCLKLMVGDNLERFQTM